MAGIRPLTRLRSQSAAVVGSVTRTVLGTGTPVADAVTITASGATNANWLGTGVLAAQVTTVSGSGLYVTNRTGTGVLQVPASEVAGTGITNVQDVTGTGVLTSQVVYVTNDAEPEIISTPAPGFTEGIPASYDLTQHVSDDGVSAVTYSLSGALPNGLSLASSTGLLSYDGLGVASVSSHQLTATDAAGSDTSGSFDIVIEALTAPSWDDTFTNLPDAVVGTPYSHNLADYGVNVEAAYAIGTSRDVSESIWPAGLSLSSAGVLSGTPTTQDEVAVVRVIGTNGTFDAAADWAFRSALSDVNITEDFPTNASVRDVTDTLSGNADRAIWDNSTFLYGVGALREEILGADQYPGGIGNWRTPIIGGTHQSPTPMGIGDEVWCAFSMRFNRDEVQWPFASTVGGTQHQLKIAIVDELGTASAFEVVNQTQYGTFRGYTGLTPSVQWEVNRATACSGSDYVYQPEINEGVNSLADVDPGLPSGGGAGSAWTSCHQDRARYGGNRDYYIVGSREDGQPDPLTGGGTMPFNWWISFQVRIRRETSASTLVEWWYAPLGEDWTLMYSDTVARGGPYGNIWFTNSHTNMAGESGVRPLCQRWYDGLITRSGSTRIPAPGYST